jgi:hypothetical protein
VTRYYDEQVQTAETDRTTEQLQAAEQTERQEQAEIAEEEAEAGLVFLRRRQSTKPAAGPA